jgi:HK97 family phage portal protein
MKIYESAKSIIRRLDSKIIKDHVKTVQPESVKGRVHVLEVPAFMEEAILGSLGHTTDPAAIYSRVWNAYRCINLIAENGATLPYKLRNVSSKEDIDSDGALNIITWKANDMYTGQLFVQSMLSFQEMYGESYGWQTVGTRKQPKEMWSLQPRRVRIVPNAEGSDIKKYVFTKNNGSAEHIDKDEMLYVRQFNPNSDFDGLSKTNVGQLVIGGQEKSEKWNDSLLSKSAKPTMLLFPEKSLSPEQREQLKAELKEKHQGFQNAGNIMIMPVNMKNAVKGEFNALEMDWNNMQKTSLRKICNLYGVPSEMLGDAESNTFSNRKEARVSFYTETVIPRGEYFISWCNHFWFPMREKELYIDKQKIDAIQSIWLDRAQTLALIDWVSPNEKREVMGMEKKEDPEMDMIWIPVGKVPITEADSDGSTGKEGEDFEDE